MSDLISETQAAGATVTAADLVLALTATIPFAGRDDTLPALQTIRLTAGDRVLTATSTDRHTASHIRRDATGDLSAVYVRRDDARMLRRIARGADRDMLVTIEHVDGKVSFGIGSRVITVDGSDGRYCAATFASLDKILATLPDAASTQLGAMVALDPRLLGRIAKMVNRLDVHPAALRFYFADPVKPVRIELQDWWLGVLMSVRIAYPPANIPVPTLEADHV